MKLAELTAIELASKIHGGEVSSREVVEELFGLIDRIEPGVQAFLALNRDRALAQAARVDTALKRGIDPGPLAGVPVAVKDNMCTRDVPTTCASRALAGYVPPFDAFVVERLRTAGAILIGKTNMDEFAMGSSTENSGYKVTHNPYDLERTPGGSSGGSAAAVASYMAPIALGSDTGGSIRQPASFCNVVGMKPTYGRVSRWGLVAFASSLDQIGPIARNCRDAAVLLGLVAGRDRKDSTSADVPTDDFAGGIDEEFTGARIGVPKEFFGAGLDKETCEIINRALAQYEMLGNELVEISLPHSEYAVAAYYLVATAEASSNLARYDGVHYGPRAPGLSNITDMYCRTRHEGFGDEVKRRIMLGTFALSSGYHDAYYLRALQARNLIKSDFDAAFEKVDVIMGPTSPTAPFKIGERMDDPLSMYLSDVYTISCNLAGIPAISVPCGFTGAGLPVGLQIIGRNFSEKQLLRAGRTLEQRVDAGSRRPPILEGI